MWLSSARFLGVLDSVADRPDVRITFDDGNASDVEYALPALNERGLRATFFVVAGRVGMPGFVDEGGLRVLTSAGMTIGCHGMRHRPWRALDECSLCEELVEAKRVLEGIVRHPVTEAACPFGCMIGACSGRCSVTGTGPSTRATVGQLGLMLGSRHATRSA